MIAFYLPGSIPVYTFAILVSCGVTLGLYWSIMEAPEELAKTRLEAGVGLLGGALVGSRLAYVAINWQYFRLHPFEAIQAQLGGLTWFGAIVGWLISLHIYSKARQVNLGELGDHLLPLVACLTTTVWLGCWIDGIAYGAPSAAWWALPARDEWGVLKPRLPVQVIGAISTIALFWLLDRIGNWKRAGWISQTGMKTTLALVIIGMQMLSLSFLRADPAPIWRGLRSDTWLAIAIIAISVLSIPVQSHNKFLGQNVDRNQKAPGFQEDNGCR